MNPKTPSVAEQHADHIRAIVDAAPPASQRQRETLAVALRHSTPEALAERARPTARRSDVAAESSLSERMGWS